MEEMNDNYAQREIPISLKSSDLLCFGKVSNFIESYFMYTTFNNLHDFFLTMQVKKIAWAV